MKQDNRPAICLCLLLLILWQTVSFLELVPKFMLPAPLDVVSAFCSDLSLILTHGKYTLFQGLVGLLCSVILAFFMAFFMDRYHSLHNALYPLLIISQTIPTVAIAPLLVLWFGYGMLPKIILIVMVCFFPLTISLLNGFSSVDKDLLHLMKSMGASKQDIFIHVKFPSALPHFFAGLKIAVSYSIIGAVISEWLGGTMGLGVYMMRVKKSYDFDKMFAVIFLVSFLSLVLIKGVEFLEKKSMPWHNKQ